MSIEPVTVQILKDVLDGIEHYYGAQGVELVASFARDQNRARESNKLIDDLEALYGASMHHLTTRGGAAK